VASVYTNSVAVIDQCSRGPLSSLFFTGGEYHGAIHSCCGDGVLNAIKGLNCTHAIIGLSGVAQDGTICVREAAEVGVLHAVFDIVQEQIIFVADSTKFGLRDTWKVTSIHELARDQTKPRRSIGVITNSIDKLSKTDKSAFNSDRHLNDARDVYSALSKYILKI